MFRNLFSSDIFTWKHCQFFSDHRVICNKIQPVHNFYIHETFYFVHYNKICFIIFFLLGKNIKAVNFSGDSQ